MTNKQMWAVVIYLGAILVPAGAIAARFGFETNVATENTGAAVTQILSIGGALVCGVVASVWGGKMLGSEADSLMSLTRRIFIEQHKTNQ